MARPYPKEFRDDVVRVARNREDGVTIEQIAADFGVHPMTLSKWLRQADIDDGATPGKRRCWTIHIPEINGRIKAPSRDEVEMMAREHIAVSIGAPIAEIAVQVVTRR